MKVAVGIQKIYTLNIDLTEAEAQSVRDFLSEPVSSLNPGWVALRNELIRNLDIILPDPQ